MTQHLLTIDNLELIQFGMETRHLRALRRARLEELNAVSYQTDLHLLAPKLTSDEWKAFRHAPGLGRDSWQSICRALRQFEAAHGIRLKRPSEHPLTAFGLDRSIANKLIGDKLTNVDAIRRAGKTKILRIEGIGEVAFALIQQSLEAFDRSP
jgi:hypothetical protein